MTPGKSVAGTWRSDEQHRDAEVQLRRPRASLAGIRTSDRRAPSPCRPGSEGRSNRSAPRGRFPSRQWLRVVPPPSLNNSRQRKQRRTSRAHDATSIPGVRDGTASTRASTASRRAPRNRRSPARRASARAQPRPQSAIHAASSSPRGFSSATVSVIVARSFAFNFGDSGRPSDDNRRSRVCDSAKSRPSRRAPSPRRRPTAEPRVGRRHAARRRASPTSVVVVPKTCRCEMSTAAAAPRPIAHATLHTPAPRASRRADSPTPRPAVGLAVLPCRTSDSRRMPFRSLTSRSTTFANDRDVVRGIGPGACGRQVRGTGLQRRGAGLHALQRERRIRRAPRRVRRGPAAVSSALPFCLCRSASSSRRGVPVSTTKSWPSHVNGARHPRCRRAHRADAPRPSGDSAGGSAGITCARSHPATPPR